MQFLEETEIWVKGEVAQGKIMLAIALLLLVAVVAIWQSGHPVLKGMLVPLSLLTLIVGGYGGFQVAARPGHLTKVQEWHAENPATAHEKELTKANKDHQAYSRLKLIWVALVIAAAVLYYLVSKEYWKGLSIGLMLLFVAGLLLDTALHHRLLAYKKVLEAVNNS